MMFRKLYWVTEEVDPLGASHVAGVFTSIPHLVQNGLSDSRRGSKLRLTLTKLDCEEAQLGSWLEPNFNDLEDRLHDFVLTEEFTSEQCHMLLDALQRRGAVSA